MDIPLEFSLTYQDICGEIAFAEEKRLPTKRITNQSLRTKDKQAL